MPSSRPPPVILVLETFLVNFFKLSYLAPSFKSILGKFHGLNKSQIIFYLIAWHIKMNISHESIVSSKWSDLAVQLSIKQNSSEF